MYLGHKTIGVQLKKLRTDLRMTQVELADRAGVFQAGVARLESQDDEQWTCRALMQIAAALGARVIVRFEISDNTTGSI